MRRKERNGKKKKAEWQYEREVRAMRQVLPEKGQAGDGPQQAATAEAPRATRGEAIEQFLQEGGGKKDEEMPQMEEESREDKEGEQKAETTKENAGAGEKAGKQESTVKMEEDHQEEIFGADGKLIESFQ